MNFFNPQIPRFLAHLPEDTDNETEQEREHHRHQHQQQKAQQHTDEEGDDEEEEEEDEEEEEEETDTSDTEDDSGIAEEAPGPDHFANLRITDPLSVQNSALNNFFHY